MRILVIEDEINLANAIVCILENQKYMADAVYDGKDGYDYAVMGQYDAIILDVMLPSYNGFEVAKKLRDAGNSTPILMLTARDDVKDRVHGLDSGADDYLTKPFDTDELLARIRALTRRVGNVQVNELRLFDIVLSLDSSLLSSGEKHVPLSYKEFEVLKLLMNNSGRLVSKEEIIVHVWGMESDAVDNNVEAYISFLRKKLFYIDSKVQIVSQRRLGYRLELSEC